MSRRHRAVLPLATLVLGVVGLAITLGVGVGRAQAPADDGLPIREDFAVDKDGDGVPDGWYNLRDAAIADGGVGPGRLLRFENPRVGRPARASRAFGVDGRAVEALVLGLWVRARDILPGERVGEEPGLLLDLLRDDVQSVARHVLGPWSTKALGDGWVRVARRVHVPPETRDAILTTGLLGATGTLEIDGLTVEAVARGGGTTTELVRNGDFRLGDPTPPGWIFDGGARRIMDDPADAASACLELDAAGARALTGLAAPIGRIAALEVRVRSRGVGLRSGSAGVGLFFLDAAGDPIEGYKTGRRLFRWAGSYDWRVDWEFVNVPRGTAQVALQVEKADGAGSLRIDDVSIVASPDPERGRWAPDQVRTDTAGWRPYRAVERITPGSALDFSFLREGPDAPRGRITAKDGHLVDPEGRRARFFGVSLLPPSAFLDVDRAANLVDRLSAAGINVVRLGGLETPLGPERSLLDDTREDGTPLDLPAVGRLDDLLARLKARGIHVALELQGTRRYREADGLPEARALPPGGGPVAAFDPAIRDRALAVAEGLFAHKNPGTGLTLRDDPNLAWVTIAGELSLFDLPDESAGLPDPARERVADALKARKLSGRRGWQALESEQWVAEARALRSAGLAAPIAGSSHWRREADFVAAQKAEGLDLLDDRLYWRPPPLGDPDRRSLLWDRKGGLVADADRKRDPGRPYVVGQFAGNTRGAWAFPFEGADLLFAAWTARREDWDALIRRGVFEHPGRWGASATGTSGGVDLFRLPGVVNGIPPLFAALPHASSLLVRGEAGRSGRSADRSRWDAKVGRLLLDTPHTQGVVGWPGRGRHTLGDLTVESDSDFAVIVASSADPEPLSRAGRVLLTVVGRSEPTGLRWADHKRDEATDPGRPPLLMEPIRARVSWRRGGTVSAFALDEAGNRAAPLTVSKSPDGARIDLGEPARALHFELIATD